MDRKWVWAHIRASDICDLIVQSGREEAANGCYVNLFYWSDRMKSSHIKKNQPSSFEFRDVSGHNDGDDR